MSETEQMEIVKSDKQGRTRYSREYRQQALEAFAISGQSAMAFAERLGVKYSTFASWVSKANRSGRKQTSEPARSAPSFMLAEIRDEVSVSGLSVSLPGGMMVRANTREEVTLLAELIKALT